MKYLSTRRSFLSQSAATLAGVSVACAAEESPKKATSGSSLKGRIFKALKGSKRQKGETLEAFFTRLQALGFDGLESGRAGEAAAYREASTKTGFRIHGLVNGGHWGVRLSDPDPAVREKGRVNLERALMNAHLLGGSSVLLVPGKVNR